MSIVKTRMERRIKRARKKIFGTAERPRMAFKKSLKYLYAQAIDDTAGKSLGIFTTASSDFKDLKSRKNVAAAVRLGEYAGKKLSDKKIARIVFDRRGRRYHGVVKSFAEALRKTGLAF
ncbi:MAG: 50S ribosomal protein L18 [Elusimicrobia bacterium HGW-Elusimicrobia-1]|nr:MAG: 50S ribosomal protein L18 [Elusimicrobia bacterium HGW-Elusimicrobia-1]